MFAFIPELKELVVGVKGEAFVMLDLDAFAKSFDVSPARMRKLIFALGIFICSNLGDSKEPSLIKVMQKPSDNVMKQYLYLI